MRPTLSCMDDLSDVRPATDAPIVTGGIIRSARDFGRRERRGDFPRRREDGGPVCVHVGSRLYFHRGRLVAFFADGGGRPGQFKPAPNPGGE